MQVRGETDRAPRKPDVPKGSATGVLVRGLDLGTTDSKFKDDNGRVKRQHKMALIFELPKYQTEFTDPVTQERKRGPVHKWLYVNLTMGTEQKPSNLRDVWKALMQTSPTANENVELRQMLGKPCLLTIGHQSSTDLHYNPETGQMEPDINAVIENMIPLPEEMPVPTPSTPLDWYEIRDDSGARRDPPSWLQSKTLIANIRSSDEWLGKGMAAAPKATLAPVQAPVSKAADDGSDVPW